MAETLHCRKSGCNRVLEVFVALLRNGPKFQDRDKIVGSSAERTPRPAAPSTGSLLFRFIAIGRRVVELDWGLRATYDGYRPRKPIAFPPRIHLPMVNDSRRSAAGRLLAAQHRGQTNDRKSTCTLAPTSSTMLNADVFDDRQEL